MLLSGLLDGFSVQEIGFENRIGKSDFECCSLETTLVVSEAMSAF